MIENPFDDETVLEHEWALQQATATYLSGELYAGSKIIKRYAKPFHHLQFFHPALEYRGSAAEGIKYKKRGTKAGMLDWQLWGYNHFHAMVEMKVYDKNGKPRGLNIPQKEVWRWLGEYGFPRAICYSVKELRDFIIGCGFECHNMGCIEPDYRSVEKKKFDSFDFFRP